jgi:DNA-binding HxlR family transcriptional regulator
MAIVIAIVISLAGLLALSRIPVARLPDIVPPQVQVSATYPGASAAVVECTVAQPIESKVIGVDKMIYMKSSSGADGPKSKGKEYTPVTAAQDVEQAFKVLEGRWKLLILFHLFCGKVLRFSELERAIPAISQKMLIQQLRQMENDEMVRRIVHHQVPPKVEYGLTDWGQALCPALDALLKWAALREEMAEGADAASNG